MIHLLCEHSALMISLASSAFKENRRFNAGCLLWSSPHWPQPSNRWRLIHVEEMRSHWVVWHMRWLNSSFSFIYFASQLLFTVMLQLQFRIITSITLCETSVFFFFPIAWYNDTAPTDQGISVFCGDAATDSGTAFSPHYIWICWDPAFLNISNIHSYIIVSFIHTCFEAG